MFFSFWSLKPWIRNSGSGSAIRKNAGSGSALKSMRILNPDYAHHCLYLSDVRDEKWFDFSLFVRRRGWPWYRWRDLAATVCLGPKTTAGKKKAHFPWLLSLLITVNQCCGSITFWCRSGSPDPCLWLMDPDPSIFIIDLQDANKKQIFKKSFSLFLHITFESTFTSFFKG